MPSKDKRVNLTLDPRMLRALDKWMAAHGYRHRASAVYSLLWDALIVPDCCGSSEGSNSPAAE